MKADLDELITGFGKRLFLGGVLLLLTIGTDQALTLNEDSIRRVGKEYDEKQLWKKKGGPSRDETMKCYAIAHDIALACKDDPMELLQYIVAENLMKEIKGWNLDK